MQRRFRVQPRSEPVALPLLNEIARDALIRCAIDRESQTNTVLIERIREDVKMPGEKNRCCECEMNCANQN